MAGTGSPASFSSYRRLDAHCSKTVSDDILGGTFRAAGVKNATGHRLRALYLTRLAETLPDEAAQDGQQISFDTVVFKLMETAGHSSPETLRHYVKLATKLRLQRGAPTSMIDLEQKRVSLERQVKLLKQRLKVGATGPR